MRVEQIMTKDVVCCGPDDAATEAARIMWERDCGLVPVAEPGPERRLLGVVTDRDLCMAAYTRGQRLAELRTGDVMTSPVEACRPQDDISHAEQLMKQKQVHRLPVVDASSQLLGIVSLADLARVSCEKTGTRRGPLSTAEVGETLAAIARPRPAARASA